MTIKCTALVARNDHTWFEHDLLLSQEDLEQSIELQGCEDNPSEIAIEDAMRVKLTSSFPDATAFALIHYQTMNTITVDISIQSSNGTHFVSQEVNVEPSEPLTSEYVHECVAETGIEQDFSVVAWHEPVS